VAGDRPVQALVRERFIWWFRLAAVAFVAVQNSIEPGDSAALSWAIWAFFAASVAASGVAIARRPDPARVARIGISSMASDTLVVAAVMANNLTDTAEPIYLVGVLAMLEATIRWRRWGGIAGGIVAGVAAGAWTVAVAERTIGEAQVDYATMRAGTIIGLGVFLGFLVRQVTEQHDTLRGILDTTQDLLVTLDHEGTILAVNAASERMLGYAPEEMVGRRYWDFFHPDDVQPRADRRLAIPSEQTVLFVRRVRCRDGSIRWLELNAVSVPSGTVHVSARDVTERLEAQRRLEESEQRFRSLFEHNSDAVYAVDLDGRFTMVNPAGERITGYGAAELVGAPYAHLMAPEELAEGDARFAQTLGGEALTYETAIVDRDGRRIELDVTSVPIVVDRDVVGLFGIAKDVTERRRLERELGHQATHDGLTGLANRAVLEAALDAATGTGVPRTLLFIDLDRFKLVNDSLGHKHGDELLIAAVDRLKLNLRITDLLVRWAGDEFCVLLAADTSEPVALQIADRLRAVLAEPFAIAGRSVRLSASIGVAAATADDVERLVQLADHAMYEAKRAGRDRVVVYAGDPAAPARTQLDLEAELSAAIDSGDVVAHYQPIVDAASGEIVALEALARWPQPDGTVRMPAEFVPLAEESGLVRHLTRRILGDACAALARWDRLRPPAARSLQAWVNTSVADLESPTFAAEVRHTLEVHGIAGSRLVLEVTETMLMRDAEQVQRTMDELRRLGACFAIDDFGTGYSSLSQLHRLRVAACKVDRGFVAQAPGSAQDAAILQALVDVGTAFGLPVVAEGIERPEELDAAREVGCPMVQGFLLGRPAPAATWDERLSCGPLGDDRAATAPAVPSGR